MMPAEVLYTAEDPWYDDTTPTQEVQTPMEPITDKQLAYLASLIEDMQKLAVDAQSKLGLASAVEHAKNIDEAFRFKLTAKTMSKQDSSTAIEHCIKTNSRLRTLLKAVPAGTAVPEPAVHVAEPMDAEAPAASTFVSDKVTEDGMYLDPADDSIYKVQVAVHGSKQLYAKKLVVEVEPVRDDDGNIVEPAKVRFDYDRGRVYKLKASMRMTIDQAKAFGALYGTCVRCGRTLTREDSIERAMGPVCAGKI